MNTFKLSAEYTRIINRIRRNPPALVLDHSDLRDSHEFVWQAISQTNRVSMVKMVMNWAAPRFRTDLAIVKTLAKANWTVLEFVSPELRSNRELFLEAMMVDRKRFCRNLFLGSHPLQFASPELQADEDLMLAAIENDASTLKFAADNLKTNKRFILRALDVNDEDLVDMVPSALWEDYEFAFSAVDKHFRALEYVSDGLKEDRDLVLEAVTHNGWALEYAPENFRNDKEIVTTAVSWSGEILEFASNSLRNDEDIVMAAVREDGSALQFASERLQGDQSIVKAAVEKAGKALEFASEQLRSNRDIVLSAVKNDGMALQFACEHLCADQAMVLAAVERCGQALEFASEQLRADRRVVLVAVKSGGWALMNASQELKGDREVVLLAVQSSRCQVLEYASPELQADREVVSTAIASQPCNFVHASEGLREDKELALMSMENKFYADEIYGHFSRELQNDLGIIAKALHTAGFYHDVWNHEESVCQGAKDRLKALSQTILTTYPYSDLPKKSPTAYVQGWFEMISKKKWLLSQWRVVSKCSGPVPSDVQHHIFDYLDEVQWANELLEWGPVIESLTLESNYSSWIGFLEVSLQEECLV